MENNNFDFMTMASKAVIILPVAILIVVLMIKSNPKNELLQSKIIPTVIPTQIPELSATATSEAKLNLQGPLVCAYQDKESSLSAFIKDNQIMVEYKKSKQAQMYLVNNDCFYYWDKLKLTGEKKCDGIKQILNIVNLLSGSNLLNIESFSSYFSQMGIDNQQLGINQAQIQKIIKSCKKENINEAVFAVPKAVRFTSSK